MCSEHKADKAVKGLQQLFEHEATKSISKSAHYLTKMGYESKEVLFFLVKSQAGDVTFEEQRSFLRTEKR